MTETIAETRLACACGTTRDAREDSQLVLSTRIVPITASLMSADAWLGVQPPPELLHRCDLRACRGCGSIYAWVQK